WVMPVPRSAAGKRQRDRSGDESDKCPVAQPGRMARPYSGALIDMSFVRVYAIPRSCAQRGGSIPAERRDFLPSEHGFCHKSSGRDREPLGMTKTAKKKPRPQLSSNQGLTTRVLKSTAYGI